MDPTAAAEMELQLRPTNEVAAEEATYHCYSARLQAAAGRNPDVAGRQHPPRPPLRPSSAVARISDARAAAAPACSSAPSSAQACAAAAAPLAAPSPASPPRRVAEGGKAAGPAAGRAAGRAAAAAAAAASEKVLTELGHGKAVLPGFEGNIRIPCNTRLEPSRNCFDGIISVKHLERVWGGGGRLASGGRTSTPPPQPFHLPPRTGTLPPSVHDAPTLLV